MWSWSKRLIAGAVLLLAPLLSGAAHAEEKARLVYSRTPGTNCPAEIELRLSIVARLGYDPFSPQASRVVLARVERRAHRLVGVVELVDREGSASGRRELYAARGHCAELARALALSISLTIDAERAATRARELPSEDPVVVSNSEPSPVLVEPTPEPPPTRTSRLFVGAMSAASTGLLPGFALGAGAYLGLGWQAWSVRLEARIMRSFSRDFPDGTRLDGSSVDPGVAGCRSVDRIEACVAGQLGVLRVRSLAEQSPRAVTKVHGTLGPRFVLSFPGRTLSFRIGLEGLLNLSFNDVRMHRREVWRAPLVSGTLLVGAETNFL